MKTLKRLRSPKPLTLTGKTVDVLTDFILGREMKHGDFLPSEFELCQQLGVSRSTLREAVQVLESRGLVKRRHGRGVEIVDQSREATAELLRLLLLRGQTTVEELLEARRLIEVRTATLAAQRATDEDIRELHDALEAMRSDSTPLEDYYRADLNFHMCIAKATRNTVLVLMVETIRPLVQETILACARVITKPELVRPYHGKIFDAVESRDPRRSADAMTEHLQGTEELLIEAGIQGYRVSGVQSRIDLIEVDKG